MRILITGSRDWVDTDLVENALRTAVLSYAPPGELCYLRHGGARGADTIAHHLWQRWCRLNPERFAPPERYGANWKAHRKAAGPLRNTRMVEAGGIDWCIAFPLGKSLGTRDCMRKAEAAGIPVLNYGD